jgi:hypothetical protein
MKTKVFLNAVLGIGTEILYTGLVMFSALLVCILFDLK